MDELIRIPVQQLTIRVDHEVHLVIRQHRAEVLPREYVCCCVSTPMLQTQVSSRPVVDKGIF